MAVHDQTYRWVEGLNPTTGHRIRVLIRYSFQTLFASKAFLVMFLNSFIPALLALVIVYVPHNATLQQWIPAELLQAVAGATLYHALLGLQLGCCTGLLVLFGPKQLTREWANQGLVLLLAQPLTRGEYLLARFLGLCLLGVGILPGSALLVFAVQAALEGAAWVGTHLHFLSAILVTGLLFQGVFSAVVLLAAALAKDAMTALGGVVAVVLSLNGLGAVLEKWLEQNWLVLLSLPQLMLLPQRHLLGMASPGDLSLSTAVLALLTLGMACLWGVWTQIKGIEVHA